jgi:L-aspartate oxidase
MKPLNQLHVDAEIVIIGGGIAGMLTALLLAPRRVALIHPARVLGAGSSSELARGGVACASHKDDDPHLHALDTLIAADGLADAQVVERLTGEAAACVLALEALGVRFDRDASGALRRGLEAAHGRARILSAGGDATGAAICEALRLAVERSPHIKRFEGWRAVFMSAHHGCLDGVVLRDPDGALHALTSAAVVLATGGVGQLYAATSNPVGALGHGLALAHQAGAALIDLEFVQFHPTGLLTEAPVSPLLTEALRGAGAQLVYADGAEIMAGIHASHDLAPRDIVARAIHSVATRGQQPFLDLRPIASLLSDRFPGALAACHAAGLDPRRALIPIAPVAHYHMGGVVVDLDGRTSVAGLWALGEVACTGLHGANRLASNSLMELIVMAHRVSHALKSSRHLDAESRVYSRLHQALLLRHRRLHCALEHGLPRGVVPRDDDAALAHIKALMTRHVGIMRDEAGLRHAVAALEALRHEGSRTLEAALTLEAASLITASSARRATSCGAHHRCDDLSLPSASRYRLQRTGACWERFVLEPQRVARAPEVTAKEQ